MAKDKGIKEDAGKAPSPVDKPLLTTIEVARMLNVDQSSVNNWVRSGKLQSLKTPGGHNRIKATEVRRFLQSSGVVGPDLLSSLSAHLPSQTRIRVLVADDDKNELRRWQRQLATTTMSELVDLRCADNGIEALVEIGAFRPQLVVLDYVMPGLDGIEVCTQLRRMPEIDSISIVLMSSVMTESVRDRALAAGAAAAWSKPRPIGDFIALLGTPPEKQDDAK